MNKQQFLKELENALKGLPQEEIESTLGFYSESIDDHIENGVSEEMAVAAVGSVEKIAKDLLKEVSLPQLVKEAIKPSRALRAWEIVLLVLGSPIWLSLIIAAIAVVFSVYVALWSVVVSLWACEVAFVAGIIGGVAAAIFLFVTGQNVFAAAIMISASIVLVGVSIFFFFACKSLTKGMVWVTKKLTLWIKSCFLRKGEA